jgi:hypothetical protein
MSDNLVHEVKYLMKCTNVYPASCQLCGSLKIGSNQERLGMIDIGKMLST